MPQWSETDICILEMSVALCGSPPGRFSAFRNCRSKNLRPEKISAELSKRIAVQCCATGRFKLILNWIWFVGISRTDQIRFAERPELVPHVSFVDIPQHMEILKDSNRDFLRRRSAMH